MQNLNFSVPLALSACQFNAFISKLFSQYIKLSKSMVAKAVKKVKASPKKVAPVKKAVKKVAPKV